MAGLPVRPTSREEFRIAIICALSLEAEMVELMLDKDWADSGPSFEKATGDLNEYTTGVLANHNVVLCYMPGMGGKEAAVCASSLRISFPRLDITFVVGICGVVPTDPRTGESIVLGDCVVSTAVMQYDFGQQHPEGFIVQTSVEDSLSRASLEIRSKMSKLQTRRNTRFLTERLIQSLQKLQKQETDISYPGREKDCLYHSEYDHGHHDPGERCKHCANTLGPCKGECEEVGCDESYKIDNTERLLTRPNNDPKIHFGRFGSANMVVKAGLFRDKVAERHNVIAFEMEGHGVWDVLSTICIKSACDYADSHKNKRWQKYAAAVAAACLKAILEKWEVFDTRINTEDGAQKTARLTGQDQQDAVSLRRKEFLSRLRFAEAEDRLMAIKPGHLETCHWLTTHKLYLDWLDDTLFSKHDGIFWIKGKAGSGKSTLMKYALQQAKDSKIEQRERGIETKEAIISFFFNARGGILGRSTIGMYRSLLFQLLNQLEVLQELLDDIPIDNIQNLPMEALENIFCAAVQRLGQQPSDSEQYSRVLCFIDALDECSENEVREMLQLFEKFRYLSRSSEDCVRFRVCFSSRHYPNISVRSGFELVLENQQGHLADIKKYVEAELHLGNSTEARTIKTELLEKSGRVFLWVVLVCRMLMKEYDRGRMFAIRQKLSETPKELNDLFKDIILRDQDNKDETILCFQWILYAKEPLTVPEFYFAMVTGLADTEQAQRGIWHKDQVSFVDMQRFVINSSKGLAESVRGGRVQFIHESVREFFLKEPQLISSWIGSHSIAASSSHERLKQICYRSVVLTEKEMVQSSASKWTVDTYLDMALDMDLAPEPRLPFLSYAIKHVFYHADKAAMYGIPQLEFLTTFPILQWQIHCERLISRPHEARTDLLILILMEHNLPVLIRQELQRASLSGNRDSEIDAICIYKASINSNVEAIVALLEPAPGRQANFAGYRQAILSACKILSSHEPQLSLSEWKILSQYEPRTRLTCAEYLTKYYVKDLAQFLLSCEAWMNMQKTAELMHLAVAYGSVEAIRKILSRGDAQIDTYNHAGQAPLYVAACTGQEEMTRFLVRSNAQLERYTLKDRATPLLGAVEYGHESTLSILLTSNANPRATNLEGATALHLAVCRGSASMTRILLEYGSDVNTRNRYGWTPLHFAALEDNSDVLDLLLVPNTDVDVQTNDGFTALWLAALDGKAAAVDRLVKRHANVNLGPDSSWTTLHAAVLSRSSKLVRALVNASADLHAKSTKFMIPRRSTDGFKTAISWEPLEQPTEISNYLMRPLHLAMLNIDIPTIIVLMELGASLDYGDKRMNSMFLPLELPTIDITALKSLQEKVKRSTDPRWLILGSWLQCILNRILDHYEAGIFSMEEQLEYNAKKYPTSLRDYYSDLLACLNPEEQDDLDAFQRSKTESSWLIPSQPGSSLLSGGSLPIDIPDRLNGTCSELTIGAPDLWTSHISHARRTKHSIDGETVNQTKKLTGRKFAEFVL